MLYNIDMHGSLDCQEFLILENVDYSPLGNPILQNISLKFCRNEMTLIVGPSGSGKSTLLKILNGLISPTRGKITYRGQALDSYQPEIYRSQVMLMGQKPYIMEGTTRDNILLALGFKVNRNLTVSADHIREVLNELGLGEEFLQKRSSKLSGGEGQRMALGRALLLRAETLLLDEPTAALDVASQDIIIRALQKIKSRTNVIVVAHSPAFINSADKIIMLKSGRVTSCGKTLSEADLKDCLESKL